MYFVVMGFFKAGAESQVDKFHAEFNEQLSQHYLRIRIAGPMVDGGRQRGWLGVLEAKSLDVARSFLRDGPYFKNGLYERYEVFEFPFEVGRLD
jgi:uncharacterized protein YciI